VRSRSPEPLLLSALVLLSLLVLLLACLIGTTPLPPDRLLATLIGAGNPADAVVVFQIRLPRALAAWLVGASLGASGAALQGLLRNPLAEPGVLGVSACATLGATTALYFGLATASYLVVPVSAIAGALIATAFLTAAALRIGSVVTLILVGVGLSSFAGALMALLTNLAPNPFTLFDMVNWMLGSVANRSLDDVLLVLPFIAVGIGLLIASARQLSALTLGEEAGRGIGLNLPRLRALVVTGAGLATGAAVALAGAVGFVGIVAPHLIRPFVHHDPARTVVPAALLAGIVLVLADVLVRLVPTQSELKLGVVAALIGAPVFVLIAMRRGDAQ
jgi:iron complex transport system permease protein